ncbi:hypothetical protein J2X90_000677 [Variovorax paradoxus]|uniref:hypothetical protein n=1 Tax=Variovorax paradoxus TaxID=34073 RepID=UPI00278A4587|nr:hypothetical protein [Variovorax paradoxus]MDQ0022891.1 hypothetical protein [Variovorax paradoxus]
MTDRELLEAAAKAAGVAGKFCAKKELDAESWGIVTFLGFGRASFWNPLVDDGDALRLAVKLEMSITRDARRPNLHAPGLMKYVYVAGHDAVEGAAEELGTDHDAATRRAIVRAAAAMAG